ncbi:MAG: DUF1761 domain-containing protein [bacterium]
MPLNWKGVLVAAFIPVVIRLIWYHPRVLGRVWMNAAGVTQEKPTRARTLWVGGLTLVFGVLMAAALLPMVIHQIHVFSSMQGDPAYGKEGAKVTLWLQSFMSEHGDKFRTFKHGALHGAIAGLFFAAPMVATNALLERRGWKYILISAGYWTVTLTLMGAVLCGWK